MFGLVCNKTVVHQLKNMSVESCVSNGFSLVTTKNVFF